MKRYVLTSMLIVGAVVVAFLANNLLFGRPGLHGDFYYNAWRPGRALIQGQNPYKAPDFLRYPLWTLLASLPFACLPASVALASWALTSECAAMGFLTAMTRGLNWQLSSVRFGLLLLLTLTFRPSLAELLAGQYVFITLLFAGVTLFGLQRKQYLLAAFCLAMSTIKPQLVFLIIPALLAWMIMQRSWSGVVSFLLTSLALMALPRALVPGWLDDWLPLIIDHELRYRTFIVPSIWGLAHSLTASHWVALASALSLMLVTALGCLWWRYRSTKSYLPFLLSATIVVTQIITPKAWNYDHAMLLLPIIHCLHRVLQSGQMGIWSKGFWLATLLGWLAVFPHLLSLWAMACHSEIPYALLPVTLGVLLFLIQVQAPVSGNSDQAAEPYESVG